MRFNGFQIVTIPLDDGPRYDLYPAYLDGDLVEYFAVEPVERFNHMGDIDLFADKNPEVRGKIMDAVERGPIDMNDLISMGWWA